MNSKTKVGRIVGALFLTLMIAYSIGAFVLIDPVLNSADYLSGISTHRAPVMLGIVLELVNGFAYIGIAILVFPFLKTYSESMALGYVVFRIVEFVMQIISDLSPLLLTSLSEIHAISESTDVSSLYYLGSELLALRHWANEMVFLNYAFGAIIFYYWLFKTNLVPRFLAIWGLVGAPLVIANVILEIFGYNQVVLLGLVMGVNEVVLGIWLLIKGFNTGVMMPSTGQI